MAEAPTVTQQPMLNLLVQKKQGQTPSEQKRPKFIEFGLYEQDGDEENGPEPIQWIVLETTEDKTLLISRYILDYQRFNGTGSSAPSTTWENSFLRNWLNNTFLDTAFTKKEQKQIITSEITTEKEDTVTKDKVFLLSYDEAWQYFKKSKDRQACGTEYVKATKIYIAKNGMSSWWLRTPSEVMFSSASMYKYVVNPDGDHKNSPRVNEKDGVRPAMWVDNSLLSIND